jgi:hypothetical protein
LPTSSLPMINANARAIMKYRPRYSEYAIL